jgi:hypothetical protein
MPEGKRASQDVDKDGASLLTDGSTGAESPNPSMSQLSPDLDWGINKFTKSLDRHLI